MEFESVICVFFTWRKAGTIQDFRKYRAEITRDVELSFERWSGCSQMFGIGWRVSDLFISDSKRSGLETWPWLTHNSYRSWARTIESVCSFFVFFKISICRKREWNCYTSRLACWGHVHFELRVEPVSNRDVTYTSQLVCPHLWFIVYQFYLSCVLIGRYL